MTVNCRTCIERAADHYDALPDQILRPSKSPRHTQARQLAHWLAVHCLKLSNGAIGERIGDVTASTVGQSCRAGEALRADDAAFFQDTDVLRAGLQGAMRRSGQWVSFDGDAANPLEVAERILKVPLGDLIVSTTDLTAMARFVLGDGEGRHAPAALFGGLLDALDEFFEARNVAAVSTGTKGARLAAERLARAEKALLTLRTRWRGTGCAARGGRGTDRDRGNREVGR